MVKVTIKNEKKTKQQLKHFLELRCLVHHRSARTNQNSDNSHIVSKVGFLVLQFLDGKGDQVAKKVKASTIVSKAFIINAIQASTAALR